jgi:DNA mismatch repair protein MutL
LSGIIKLLSDAVANQIAAGEVVQRPASAVKELLENSIDAGATEVKLLIKDGGSTLMQVIDNGKGMSETDARLCWERHATSKIRKAQDLFSLNTYGFRGEALASIAAVAQVEMKTRRPEDSVATYIRIEGSEVLDVKIESAPIGTSISIKNLFYNIPARRNFLKAIAVETKHIFEEFQRQALTNPHIAFQLFNQNVDVFDFPIRPLKDRVADVLGRKKIDAFIDVNEPTEIIDIQGFIGAPELARKTRGDQFFYVALNVCGGAVF